MSYSTAQLRLVPRSKNELSYTSAPQYTFMAWCLDKHMDTFTFTFIVSFGLFQNIIRGLLMFAPPSNAEVKECVELYIHSPNTPSWRGAQLKHRNKFILLVFVCVCVCVCRPW
jgi:hypothetical protein